MITDYVPRFEIKVFPLEQIVTVEVPLHMLHSSRVLYKPNICLSDIFLFFVTASMWNPRQYLKLQLALLIILIFCQITFQLCQTNFFLHSYLWSYLLQKSASSSNDKVSCHFDSYFMSFGDAIPSKSYMLPTCHL